MVKPMKLTSLACRLGLPQGWLRDEALQGRIPCVKANDALLFDAEAVGLCLRQRAKTERISPAAEGQQRGPVDSQAESAEE